MRDLSKMADTVSKAMVGYERIQEVLDIESRVRDVPRARRAPTFTGQIEFDKVSFGYGADRPILKDVSFTIEAGQVAAHCRSVGGGEDDDREPDSAVLRSGVRPGRHRGRGHPAVQVEVAARPDEFRPAGHRALPRDDLGEHRVRQAGRVIPRDQARGRTGERAASSSTRCPTATTRWWASAASRSRAASASASRLPAPSSATRPILILDEPTAGLDAGVRAGRHGRAAELMKGRTSVVIAHRLGTIRHADVDLRHQGLRAGRTGHARGAHGAGGVYAELHRIQNAADVSATAAVATVA